MGVTGGPARLHCTLPVPPNALVGRETELASLDRLLAEPDSRLLTLTGPPGVGKTRLAIAAAAGAAPRFRDGVEFVDLTPVRDPQLVASQVAGALGLHGSGARGLTDHLAGSLARKDVLLVLDNFEHVLPAGPGLAGLLGTCPRLRILVTSRERLHLRAERELPVQPLALPDAGAEDLTRLASTPSVAMLLARVQAFQPDFAVTRGNGAALAEICLRLDGLPLALELAAARLKLFTPGELTFRLRHRIGVLTGGSRDSPDRHRTLRAALRWSYDLLSEPERTVFRQLSVFVGGATLDAVAQVCGEEAVETVASLVDKSLVQRRIRPGDVAELVMLESLREYALELLAASGEAEPSRERHTRYYAELAVRTEARMGAETERSSVTSVGFDEGNLRAALEFAIATGQGGLCLHLAAALGWYCYTRGRLGEGKALLDRALAAVDADPGRPPDDAVAGALLVAAVIAFGCGALDRAEEQLVQALEVNHRGGSRRRRAIGTAFLGHIAQARGRQVEAIDHYERAGLLYEQIGSALGVAWSRYDLGLLARRRGNLGEAAQLLRESLTRFRELEYPWAIGYSGWALAAVELRRGRTAEAATLLGEALASCTVIDDSRGVAQCFEGAAALACARGDHRTAAQLLGAAAALRERLAAPLPDEDHAEYHVLVERVRHHLGPDQSDRARRAGSSMPQAAVVGLAHRVVADPKPTEARTTPAAAPLTPRERQVALLIAKGRTNRQIGRELGIAEKTAAVHVHNAIRKLGARSRAEVAAWVAGSGGYPTPLV
jgi:non-specific serine/threonine protein kinase